MPASLACHRTATPAAVRCARAAVREFAREAGASPELIDDVQLAVSEAVTNVVLHAYPEAEPGPVAVEGRVEDDELLVDVRDEGSGMEPRFDSPGAGVGLRVIAQLAQALKVESGRDRRGTCVRMRFAL